MTELCDCEGASCVLTAHDLRHGTINGYTNLKCRCDDCRAANARASADYVRRNPGKRSSNYRRVKMDAAGRSRWQGPRLPSYRQIATANWLAVVKRVG